MDEEFTSTLPDAIVTAHREFLGDDECIRSDHQRQFGRLLARHMTRAYQLGYADGLDAGGEKGDG